ncbi:MAG: AAA family ATPase [Firmicutes bacterium]|nr:AAA family ATPase [Bacillota bacterium]
MKPIIVVLEGPSGVGKDTVARELNRRFPDIYVKMPSITDRAMREGENQGNPYFFVSTEEFKKKITTGDVFEYTIVARDNLHRGMSKQIIEGIAKTGRIQIKDCDWIGIEALKREYGTKNVIAIYLSVPKEEVARRIHERGGSVNDIQNRIADFENYAVKIQKYCDHSIENIILDSCVNEIHTLVQSKFKTTPK